MKVIVCKVCGRQQLVQTPDVPQGPTIEQCEKQLRWGSSSDGYVLCPRHAPMSSARPLKDVAKPIEVRR